MATLDHLAADLDGLIHNARLCTLAGEHGYGLIENGWLVVTAVPTSRYPSVSNIINTFDPPYRRGFAWPLGMDE